MNTVTLEMKLSEKIYLALQSAGLGRDELGAQAARNLAIQLYDDGRLPVGKAAEMAGMPLLNFWLLLNERGIPVFDYSEEDYEADFATVRRFMAKEAKSK